MNSLLIMFLSIILSIIFLIITKIKTGNFLQINVIYSFLWIIIIIFSINNTLDLIKPRNQIYVLIFWSIILFNIIYLITYKKNIQQDRNSNTYIINLKKVVLLNIIAYILFLPNIISAFKIIIGNGLNLLLIRNTIYVGITNTNNALVSIIFRTIPTAIFMFTEIISSYFLVKRENKRIILLGISDVLVGTLIFGGRNFLLNYIIFYFFNYINTDRVKKIKLKKRYIVLAILILFFVSSNRNVSNISFIQTIVLYFAGSLSFLEYILCNPTAYGLDIRHYGSLIFGFITEPIIIIFKTIFRINAKVPSYYFNIYAQKFVQIGTTKSFLYNNNTTFWYPFMLDFGIEYAIIGAIIYFIMICFVSNKKNSGNLKFYFIYIYLCSTIINSSVSYKLIGLSSTIIISLVLFVIERRKKNGI